jgi:hypothetical protein
MNKGLSKLLATVLVTAMLLGAMPMIMPAVRASEPAAGNAFWLVPDSFSFNTAAHPYVGDLFNVTVWAKINSTETIYAYNIGMTFDYTQIECTRVGYTNDAKSMLFTGVATSPVTAVWDNTTGYILAGESLQGSNYLNGPLSNSTIWVEFEIMAAPAPGNPPLTSTISVNTVDTYFLDKDLHHIPDVGFGDASYSMAWVAPSNPHLEVHNSTTNSFDMYNHWVDTTFIETIWIMGLSSGWYCANATTDFQYNGTLLSVTNVAYGSVWTGPGNSKINATGDLTLYVEGPSPAPPSGNVLIATVTMKILNQGQVPPQDYGHYDVSKRTLTSTLLMSTYSSIGGGTGIIPVDPQPATPDIWVFAFLKSPPPCLSAEDVIVGPNPMLGDFFDVDISLNNVTSASQHLIGIQFRVQYDASLMTPVLVTEGPFFPHFADLENASGNPPAAYPPGTWFTSFFDPDTYGPNILVGTMILPDNNGVWHDPLPDGTGVIATITFQLIGGQSYGEPDVVTPLTFVDTYAIGLSDMSSQNIVPVTLGPSVPGSVTITTSWLGRYIDLYGGAVNSGYGHLVSDCYWQFPAPYGGQGLNAPMDMVEPQSWVYLNANVTYNWWPVQHKNVAFEIQEPDGTVYNKLSAFTDSNGVAQVGFRMPWPCVDPESLFGVWHVTATVQLADVVITDTMAFHYDYIVNVFKVTVDKFQYTHSDCVVITFDYGSYAMETYPVLFIISIIDNLGVTVGIQVVQTTVGGVTPQAYCHYKFTNGTQVTICLPKWAYAGLAMVHINTFDKEPAEGGVAISPEWVGPTIAIQPY